MSHRAIFIVTWAAIVSLLAASTACAQLRKPEDRTLSPYFFVKSDDPQTDLLPLKSTSAAVKITGVIADVEVNQVYRNEGRAPLEAIYVFPASTRAAVYGMKMTIGERIITAKIGKRADARREYEQAREQGQSASLLEQQRPNVFQMNVANIMPGDEIAVDLRYTELLVPTDRIYEFVYPTVVGPRYSNAGPETADPSQRWMQNPYLHDGEAPPHTFDIAVSLAAGLPINALESPSHRIHTTFNGPSLATVTLDPSETRGGNRDYILRYRLAGEKIQSGLLLHEGERENFFLLMMQPPRRVAKEEIPGREYIFIVDVSGSMHGFPLDISKTLLKNLVGNLRSIDRFNVLLFSGGSSVMSEQSLPATAENIQRAVRLIESQQGGGGTELLPAFRRALALPKTDGFSRSIVIATDGYVTVEEEVFDLIRRKLGDANVFAFGVGSSVNRHIIEGMARVGMGEPFVIAEPDQAASQAERFRAQIQSPVLAQVRVGFEGFAAYDVEPIAVPDVLAERPVIVFGKWRGQPQGKITLSGMSGKGPYRQVIAVQDAKPLKEASALQYLWARHRISLLSDYNQLHSTDERVREVTNLGLTYNLLTAYTSFVAVDSEVRNAMGRPTPVKQPLPLPQGVSDYAVDAAKAAQVSGTLMAKKARVAEASNEPARRQEEQKEKDRPGIRISGAIVSGEASKELVLNIVQQGMGDLDRCLSLAGPGGKLVVEFSIDSNGKVKDIKIVSNPSKDRNADRCLIETMKKWRFPGVQGRRDTKVTFSFDFT